jgi:pyridoxal/pyridoxine/pyridoxamine kinase
MKLATLLKKANKGYPDGFLSQYFDEKTGKPKKGMGDLLANFIVVELSETFTPGQEVQCAVQALETAIRNLNDTITALEASK